MAEVSTEAKEREKVWELIKDIKFALLVTHADSDRMSARPMAAMQDDFEGTLWFFTSITSPKTQEIERNPHVLLSYADTGSNNYVSVQGTAEISRDKELVKRLWKEPARVWFPDGVDDPEIAVLRVDADSAEYWDAPSSKLVHLYGYVKARVTGEPPKGGENKIVAFS